MPYNCLFLNCTSVQKAGSGISFFKIPRIQSHRCEEIKILTEKRRNAWLRIINLDLSDGELRNGCICEKHFLGGCPAVLEDETNPDWVPCKNLDIKKGHFIKRKSDLERFERCKRRAYSGILKINVLIENDLNFQPDRRPNISLPNKMISTNDIISLTEYSNENLGMLEEINNIQCLENNKSINETIERDTAKETIVQTDLTPLQLSTNENISDALERTTTKEAIVQTNLTSLQLSLYMNDMNVTNSLILQLKNRIDKLTLTENSFKGNDAKTKYFTGINSYKILSLIHETIAPFLTDKHDVSSLSTFQQLIITLMKLRLNLDFKYLADRFEKSPTTISQYFNKCLDVLYYTFKGLIYWPSKEALIETMPSCFRESFKDNVAVIIDCFEIFIENPANLYTGAQCWSNYKHHKTVKILIGITPQGTISFISDVYGGRISDKALTEDSGILQNLRPSDIILADRGFLIEDSVRRMHAQLRIPAFTKGKSQLNPLDLEETRSIAHVRIHVERVIGSLRQKFTILTGILPISLIGNIQGKESKLDKIVRVCCAIYNLNPAIVT